MNKEQQIEQFLTRGVEAVFPSKEAVAQRLASSEPLTMYLGIDPTGPTLHVGHLIPLMKLRQFQELGHKPILLIGDFTAMIGDPTDKSAMRVRQTREQVLENAKLYQTQVSKILSFEGPCAAEMTYNSTWLAQLTFEELVDLASHFTVQQMLHRDMFVKRLAEEKPIYLHEFFYPLMQGYDSVAMDVDGEVGGNDQTFNMLAGRTLMKAVLGKDKFVIASKLLTDASGKKMGKTEGNMITLADSPSDVYGKIMSWSDEMILPGFELLTMRFLDELETLEKRIDGGENPRDIKAQLALEVTTFLHGQDEAMGAAEAFEDQFSKGALPEEINEIALSLPMTLVDVLVATNGAASKSDARRLIEGGGVKVNNEVVLELETMVTDATLVQKGKRFFVRVISND